MRSLRFLAVALVAVTTFTGGVARANTCQAGNHTCATTMPIGGYCECTARGETEGGTVVGKPAPRRSTNATAGGCGAHPGAPGCR